MSQITMYHNPNCGTSRNTLELIRNSGEEPTVIEYLQTPPDRATLIRLIKDMGIEVRALLRVKGTPYEELGLSDASLTDEQLIDALMAYPILINRPIVVTPLGTRLCRPSEAVLDLLPQEQRGAFVKEDGHVVIDEHGRKVWAHPKHMWQECHLHSTWPPFALALAISFRLPPIRSLGFSKELLCPFPANSACIGVGGIPMIQVCTGKGRYLWAISLQIKTVFSSA